MQQIIVSEFRVISLLGN